MKTGDASRFESQLKFILEIDKLKTIERRSYPIGLDRLENSAEHSWHVALMAQVFAEYADENVNLLRVQHMLLIHDLVEIDAGDTFIYDEVGNRDKAERERAAADRILSILPKDQARELRTLWDEFESCDSADSRFAAALDRLMPLLHNFHTEGRSWRQHGIVKSQVVARNRSIAEGSQALWEYAKDLIDEAVRLGYLKE